MKKIILGILIISILLLSACASRQGVLTKEHDKRFSEILDSVEINVKTSDPYPESDGNRTLVWEHVLELNHEEADAVHLNFDYLNVIGWHQEMYYEKDFGECDLNAPEGFTRELVNNNTISERAIVEEQEEGVYSIGSLTMIPCNVHTLKKQILCDGCEMPDESEGYITYQEYIQNIDKYVGGDYILFKDEKDNILSINFIEPGKSLNINKETLLFPMTEKIKIQLYAKKDNTFRYHSLTMNEFGEIIEKGEMLGKGISLKSVDYIKQKDPLEVISRDFYINQE